MLKIFHQNPQRNFGITLNTILDMKGETMSEIKEMKPATDWYICKKCGASVERKELVNHTHKFEHHEYVRSWSDNIVLCVG